MTAETAAPCVPPEGSSQQCRSKAMLQKSDVFRRMSSDEVHEIVEDGEKSRKGDGTKLIINSNAKYDIARKTLFASLLQVGFSRFQDVVVMLGGATSDSEPYAPSDDWGQRGVTYVDIKLDSFDYHGFSGLYHHKDHALVSADRYLFIHDTVVANDSFPEAFDSLSGVTSNELYSPPAPFSNICAFGRGVVEKWKTNFDSPVTKAGAVSLEFGTPSNGILPLVTFAEKKTLAAPRVDTGKAVDLYHTGMPRNAIYYPAFKLTKYLLFNKFGDLTGNVSNTYLLRTGKQALLQKKANRESDLNDVDHALGP